MKQVFGATSNEAMITPINDAIANSGVRRGTTAGGSL
jgi:hypothetical protein